MLKLPAWLDYLNGKVGSETKSEKLKTSIRSSLSSLKFFQHSKLCNVFSKLPCNSNDLSHFALEFTRFYHTMKLHHLLFFFLLNILHLCSHLKRMQDSGSSVDCCSFAYLKKYSGALPLPQELCHIIGCSHNRKSPRNSHSLNQLKISIQKCKNIIGKKSLLHQYIEQRVNHDHGSSEPTLHKGHPS